MIKIYNNNNNNTIIFVHFTYKFSETWLVCFVKNYSSFFNCIYVHEHVTFDFNIQYFQQKIDDGTFFCAKL